MTTWTCPNCDRPMATAPEGDDAVTSVSVSQHRQGRSDFAISLCRRCADEFLRDLVAAVAGTGKPTRPIDDETLDAMEICRYCYETYSDCTCPEATETA